MLKHIGRRFMRRRLLTRVSWYPRRLETSLALIERAVRVRSASIIDVGGGESTLLWTIWFFADTRTLPYPPPPGAGLRHIGPRDDFRMARPVRTFTNGLRMIGRSKGGLLAGLRDSYHGV
jgi:hypothetical protein